jgi:hypothetical protein
MQYANELPGDLRDRLCAPRASDEPHQPATASSGGATIVTQTNIPSDALDLKPESLMKWIRYCNSCISSGQDLRVGSWPIEFKTYVNNRWGNLIQGRPKSEWKAWQNLPPTKIKDTLTNLLPKNHQFSTTAQLGKTHLQIFQEWYLAHKLRAHFEGDIDEMFTIFQDHCTEIEIHWNKMIALEQPEMSVEVLMAKSLWKDFRAIGPPDSSKQQLRLEIEHVCAKEGTFLRCLEALQEKVSAKYRLLQEAYAYMPVKEHTPVEINRNGQIRPPLRS